MAAKALKTDRSAKPNAALLVGRPQRPRAGGSAAGGCRPGPGASSPAGQTLAGPLRRPAPPPAGRRRWPGRWRPESVHEGSGGAPSAEALAYSWQMDLHLGPGCLASELVGHQHVHEVVDGHVEVEVRHGDSVDREGKSPKGLEPAVCGGRPRLPLYVPTDTRVLHNNHVFILKKEKNMLSK